MDFFSIIWIVLQVVIGYNLILPALLYLLWPLLRKRARVIPDAMLPELDYAFIVTAYQYTETLPAVVSSILALPYQHYVVYIVADNCDISNLHFEDDRIVVLRPPEVLASNTRSHHYALKNFRRPHDVLTIIDSDNLVDPAYLREMNIVFATGADAVQGLRAAKNLEGQIAALDAARDIYYHFYDGRLLYEIGSSATLSGSGMAFRVPLYREFLESHDITGAGFDKVLQAWLLNRGVRIAFSMSAVVFDEKTSRPEQLINQRSRWINTWFKYFKLGFGIFFKGLFGLNRNQFFFGIVLLRPPLFLFLLASVLCMSLNLLTGNFAAALLWLLALVIFIVFFFVALLHSHTDKRIYKSLKNIPGFIGYQLLSLLKSRRANKISVSTQHFYTGETEKDKDEA